MATKKRADVKGMFADKRNIALVEGLARDGYTIQQIADRLEISVSSLKLAMKNDDKVAQAVTAGREVTDYLVESALLKSALGYVTKDVKTIVTMQNGVVTDTRKETTKRRVSPNVFAIQTWLFNRRPDKWKRDGRNALEIDEDTSVNIVVTRADKAQIEKERAESQKYDTNHVVDNALDNEWEQLLNDSVTVRGATKEESQKATKEANAEIEAEKRAAQDARGVAREKLATILIEDNDAQDEAQIDYDYWPDDWVDTDEDS